MSTLRYSLRSLSRAPVVAAASMLTVALAIAGTTSVFALLDAAVLRSMPYPDADRLVAVWTDVTGIADEVGIQDPLREYTNLDTHRDLRAAATTLDDLAVFTGWSPSFRLAYVARATTPGQFVWPASRVEDMYDPASFARTRQGRLEVTAR